MVNTIAVALAHFDKALRICKILNDDFVKIIAIVRE